MRERDELAMARFPQGPLYVGASRDFEQAADRLEGSNTALAEADLRGTPKARPARRAARWMAVLAIVFALLAAPAASRARVSVGIAVSFGPPALPYYAQPLCPGPGYIWTPGYWAWDPDYGYYWVPGTWVEAPFVGALWTPGYWGFENGFYVWSPGYWGTVVGFYGGIDYGYGYTGYGYQGGFWRDRDFYYNRAVNNVRTSSIRYVYDRRVDNPPNVARVSYNGGPHGTRARPTAEQLAAERQRRSGPIVAQRRQLEAARRSPAQRARENRGRPEVAATVRPGEFNGHAAVRATRAGAPYRPQRSTAEGAHPFEQSHPARTSGRGEYQKVPSAKAPRRTETPPRTERTLVEKARNQHPTYQREAHPPQNPRRSSAPPPAARRSEPHARQHAQGGHPSSENHGGGHHPPNGRGR
jgi:WXXGXW repeat (2 copies)